MEIQSVFVVTSKSRVPIACFSRTKRNFFSLDFSQDQNYAKIALDQKVRRTEQICQLVMFLDKIKVTIFL